ncbi:hypothetical protein R5R35_006056 [Gryllus longicercus]
MVLLAAMVENHHLHHMAEDVGGGNHHDHHNGSHHHGDHSHHHGHAMNHGMHAHHGGHMTEEGCVMQMWFYMSSCVIEMFSGNVISELPLFLGYLMAIVLSMMVYEILKHHRDVIFTRTLEPLEVAEGTSLLTTLHFYQTLLHAVQLFSSYLFMLLFMTYNGWVCLAVVVGSGIGYYLVGWRKTEYVLANVSDQCCN